MRSFKQIHRPKANRQIAIERVVGFARKFSETHLILACHAAFPLSLTPDLLYHIWAHFVPQVPWTSVADLLLSNLCDEVGNELYEMDLDVRNLLLEELQEDKRFGRQRLNDLADFLMDYVVQQLNSKDPDLQDLAKAQRWTALAYTRSVQAARELAQVLSELVGEYGEGIEYDNGTELIRLSSLVETLEKPLGEFTPLLIYARGMAHLARDDWEGAKKQFDKMIGQEKVAGVVLPIPKQEPEETLEEIGKRVIKLGDYLAKSWTHKRGVNEKIKITLLAAGLGKRMDPLTAHHLPKPMFPLGGSVPMLETWIRECVKSGITDISMNLCVLSDTIRNYFQDGAKFGANITYVEEYTPTGTLGGVCKQALGNKAKKVFKTEVMHAIEEFKGTTIIAPSGDIVTNFGAGALEEMYEIHQKQGAAFTMVLAPIPWEKRGEFGTVELESPESLQGAISKSGRIINFREKDPDSPSNLNNASIYMIEMELLKILDPLRTELNIGIDEPFYDFGKHVFPAMLGELNYVTLPKDFLLWGIQYDGLWFDVGRKQNYLDVNKFLLDGNFEIEIPYEKLPWGYLGTDVTMDFSKVTIIPPIVIGNNCTIQHGVTLGPYAIIGDGWTIERGARISNSVLWKRYSYFPDDGDEISAEQRELDDRHEIRRGVTVDECIIIGGTIERNLKGKTVDVLEDGHTEVLPIDWVPVGRRA